MFPWTWERAVGVSIGVPPPSVLVESPKCESCLAMKIVADSGRLLVLDRVEVNPVVDTENATNSLAVELISSGL